MKKSPILIAATAYSLKLVKNGDPKKAFRFDMIVAQSLLFLYIVANIYFIWEASSQR